MCFFTFWSLPKFSANFLLLVSVWCWRSVRIFCYIERFGGILLELVVFKDELHIKADYRVEERVEKSSENKAFSLTLREWSWKLIYLLASGMPVLNFACLWVFLFFLGCLPEQQIYFRACQGGLGPCASTVFCISVLPDVGFNFLLCDSCFLHILQLEADLVGG